MYFSLIMLLSTSLRSLASGCGSYDSWLKIQRTQVHTFFAYAQDEFEIISNGEFFIRIRVKDNPKVTLTLPLQSREAGTLSWKDVRLLTDDVDFEEGHGCGPVYNCKTGRYTLRLPPEIGDVDKRLRIFAWPVLREYRSPWQNGWVASDLLPPFALPISRSNSSQLPKQCTYGDW